MVTLDPTVDGSRVKQSSASIRREKFEKLKMNNSATSIQATWRGTAHRRDIRKVGAAAYSEPGLGCAYVSSDHQTNLITSEVESNKDDEDDRLPETKDDIDDEEGLAVSAAERLEEKLIKDAENGGIRTWPQALSDDFESPDWPDLGPMNNLSFGIGALFLPYNFFLRADYLYTFSYKK